MIKNIWTKNKLHARDWGAEINVAHFQGTLYLQGLYVIKLNLNTVVNFN